VSVSSISEEKTATQCGEKGKIADTRHEGLNREEGGEIGVD